MPRPGLAEGWRFVETVKSEYRPNREANKAAAIGVTIATSGLAAGQRDDRVNGEALSINKAIV
jgi:hypothetical protein